MRKTILLAVLTISSTAAATAFAGSDGLFSKSRLGETSPSPGTTEKTSRRSQGRSVSGVNTLQAVLLAAGYSARVDQNETVTIDMSRSDWTATVAITLTDGERGLRLAMQLTNPAENTLIAPKTLRGMLTANGTNGSTFFAIIGDPQRIELVKTIPNDGLASSNFRDDLEALADLADKTKDVWNADGVRIRTTKTTTTPAATTTPPTTTTPTTPATPPATTTASLIGKWIANATKTEAFALQLDADGTFRLVHVKGTASTKSKGTYTLAGTTLTLKGDDNNTLAGTITRQTDGFTFTLNGTSGKPVTLNFKSGS